MKGSTQLFIERLVLSSVTLALWAYWCFLLIEWKEEIDITNWIVFPIFLFLALLPLLIEERILVKDWFPHIDRLEAKDRMLDEFLEKEKKDN